MKNLPGLETKLKTMAMKTLGCWSNRHFLLYFFLFPLSSPVLSLFFVSQFSFLCSFCFHFFSCFLSTFVLFFLSLCFRLPPSWFNPPCLCAWCLCFFIFQFSFIFSFLCFSLFIRPFLFFIFFHSFSGFYKARECPLFVPMIMILGVRHVHPCMLEEKLGLAGLFVTHWVGKGYW